MKRLKNEGGRKLTVRQAFTIILGATVIISGTAALALLCYFHVQEIVAQSDRFVITCLDPKCRGDQALSTGYLAELLDLSSDHASNLYRVNTSDVEFRLLASPVVQFASAKKIEPNTLSIEYALYRPFVKIHDLTNTVADEDGHLFPLEPFYQNVRLPELHLGLPEEQLAWGKQINVPRFQIAKNLMAKCSGSWKLQSLTLIRIDVSKLEAKSAGCREIVLFFEESLLKENARWLTRLSPDSMYEQMERFFSLRNRLTEEGIAESRTGVRVVDLRIPRLAFTDSE